MPIDKKLFEKAAAMAKRANIDGMPNGAGAIMGGMAGQPLADAAMPNGPDAIMGGMAGQPMADSAMPGGADALASPPPELAGPPTAGMGSPVGPPIAGMGGGGAGGGDGLAEMLRQYAPHLAIGGGAVGLGALAAYMANRKKKQEPEMKMASVASHLGRRAAIITRK